MNNAIVQAFEQKILVPLNDFASRIPGIERMPDIPRWFLWTLWAIVGIVGVLAGATQ